MGIETSSPASLCQGSLVLSSAEEKEPSILLRGGESREESGVREVGEVGGGLRGATSFPA